ncbi:YqcI/YcgG family protein [Actinosynnema sp. NPDC047251]|uniref:YqcI/YcgG family protein n=1 Tax=Saccharothrix espanaensis TaxID=103731 RepID=UPI000305B5D9|nr:YqcI/YcgG family protein [Saccharothrix espanaensis]
MIKTNEHAKLISQARVGDDASGWSRTAFGEIADRLTEPDFPCVFSKNAFRKQIVQFLFVPDAGSDGIRHLADGLLEYVELSRRWDGRLDSASPLVVVFGPAAVNARSVADYHAFGWQVLSALHDLDPAGWPEGIGTDPDSEGWSMCFDGMPLFVNMSNPAHRVRRSRNLGGHFALVVNPRERFDVFAGDTPSGRRVRANIRERVERYDGTPHSWQLGSYADGELEWRQYGLIEENAERTDRCPFTFRRA